MKRSLFVKYYGYYGYLGTGAKIVIRCPKCKSSNISEHIGECNCNFCSHKDTRRNFLMTSYLVCA